MLAFCCGLARHRADLRHADYIGLVARSGPSMIIGAYIFRAASQAIRQGFPSRVPFPAPTNALSPHRIGEHDAS